MTIALHWFRRDLRLADNTALTEAQRRADEVVPVFVLDSHLLRREDMGASRVSFLLESLTLLGRDLEERGSLLLLLEGDPAARLAELVRATGAKLVTANRDHSPYARRRDAAVRRAIEREGATWLDFKDQLLVEPDECRKDDGAPYTVFTPFARRWRLIEKELPQRAPRLRSLSPDLRERLVSQPIPSLGELGFGLEADIEPGGERQAKKRLATFVEERLLAYAGDRNAPALDGTSHLSAHLKFGTISPRRVYGDVRGAIGDELANLDPARPPASLGAAERDRLREGGTFLNELCWREFYQAILFHFPHVVSGPFRRGFAKLRWPGDDPSLIEAWREGRTGFPIVAAGMRQLAQTGWMHNRLRMITATFLTKTLLVDWRVGERIFLQRLTDGDVAANNGGWQWCASTGTDASPYFRIFNPTLQSKKFDPKGEFLRRFIPELRRIGDELVHEPWRKPRVLEEIGYPPPCVDYAAQRERALALLAPFARGSAISE